MIREKRCVEHTFRAETVKNPYPRILWMEADNRAEVLHDRTYAGSVFT